MFGTDRWRSLRLVVGGLNAIRLIPAVQSQFKKVPVALRLRCAPLWLAERLGLPAKSIGARRILQPSARANLTRNTLMVHPGPALLKRLRVLCERLHRSPHDSETWRMLGRSHLRAGNYAKAVEAYERALQLNPESPGYPAGSVETTEKPDGTIRSKRRHTPARTNHER